MSIKVGRWDCPVCGHKANLGPEKQCASCGSARPQNVKFYLASDAEIVKDESIIRQAKAGADWVCSYCNSHNKVNETHCHTCGNDKSVKDGDKSLEQKINYTDGRNENSKNASQNSKINISKLPKVQISKKMKVGCLGTIGFLVLLFISLFFTSEIEVQVSSFEWKRSLKVEKYIEVVEENWQIPQGGKQISSFEAVHHYNKIPDGTETKTRTVSVQTGSERVVVGQKDLGNGYFEDVYEDRPIYTEKEETYEETKYREEPVYKTKYKYSIFRWKDAGTFATKGKDKKPYWSEKFDSTNVNTRIKSKKASYFVIINEGKETHKEEISFEKWQKTTIGDKLKAKKSRFFGIYYGLVEK